MRQAERYIAKVMVEEAVFEHKGTWEAINAAMRWVHERGFTAGSSSSPLPLALVKGDYGQTPLPNKWKNFKKHHMQHVDGTITGDFREGPVRVRLYVK